MRVSGNTLRRAMACGLAFGALVASDFAKSASFGDWSTGTTDDGNLYAGVMNESGSALMKVCSAGQNACIWYLITSTGCEPGDKFPVLVNSSLGSTTTEMICDRTVRGHKNLPIQYRYGIANYDLVERIVTSPGAVGLAMALESGRFAVARFSLTGASQATRTLEEATIRLMRKNPVSPRGNADSLL